MNDENTAWTSIDLYYKGVHVKKSLPQNVKIEDLIKTVDTYLEAGFKPSWNEETNNGHSQRPADLGKCHLCGADNAWSDKKQKTYCSKTCWLKK